MYGELREAIHEVAQHIPIHGITLNVDENVPSIDQHRTTQYTRKLLRYIGLFYL